MGGDEVMTERLRDERVRVRFKEFKEYKILQRYIR
jgi:hypothetical protein